MHLVAPPPIHYASHSIPPTPTPRHPPLPTHLSHCFTLHVHPSWACLVSQSPLFTAVLHSSASFSHNSSLKLARYSSHSYSCFSSTSSFCLFSPASFSSRAPLSCSCLFLLPLRAPAVRLSPPPIPQFNMSYWHSSLNKYSTVIC